MENITEYYTSNHWNSETPANIVSKYMRKNKMEYSPKLFGAHFDELKKVFVKVAIPTPDKHIDSGKMGFLNDKY